MTVRYLLGFGLGVILISTTVAALPRDAQAVAFPEWDGFSFDSLWSVPGNWSTNTAPANGDYLEFGDKSLGGTLNNDIANLSVTRLTFSGRSYILQGNPLTISESIVVEQSAGNHAIELNISGVAQTLIGSGGELKLSGNNAFTGQIDVVGRLEAASDAALGSITGPTRVLPGGSMSFAERDFGMEPIQVSGSETLSSFALVNQSGTSVLRNLQLGEGEILFLNGGTMTYPNGIGQFTVGSNLLLAGGLHIVGGTTTAQGIFRVAGGTDLIWNAISPNQEINFEPLAELFALIDETAPASLRGNGALDDLYFRDGTFGAGTGATPGKFTMGSGLDIAQSTFFAQLNSAIAVTGYSQVQAGDFVSIGPNTELALAVGFQPPVGTQFRLIDVQLTFPVTGAFNGLPEGKIFQLEGRTWSITYKGGTGNDVVITRVAETPLDPLPFKRTLPMVTRS